MEAEDLSGPAARFGSSDVVTALAQRDADSR
jgi:hypothetical protein